MYEAADQSWHQHVLCLMQQNRIRTPPHPVSKSAAPWKLPTAAIQACQSARKPSQYEIRIAGNCPACSPAQHSAVACCQLQTWPMESRASKGVLVEDKNDAAETRGQHHLVPGKCDQIHSKTSHKRHNTPLVYQMGQQC